jgi:hypothetical protein
MQATMFKLIFLKTIIIMHFCIVHILRFIYSCYSFIHLLHYLVFCCYVRSCNIVVLVKDNALNYFVLVLCFT